MSMVKRSIHLFLVMILFSQGSLVYAQINPNTTIGISHPGAVEEAEKPQRVNPPNTPVGVTCSIEGEKPLSNGVCCVGVVPNQAGVCDEPVMEDKTLVSCDSQTLSCGLGMACLPLNRGAMFTRLAPTSENANDIKDQRREFISQVSDLNPKEDGQQCTHPRECKSYNCNTGLCKEKNVCRMAAEGEVAGAARCGPNLLPNANKICELSEEAKNSVYLGLLDEVTPVPTGQCQFEVPKDQKEKALVAMRALRAMEFFLASNTIEPQNECFMTLPVLKLEVGVSMYETRKNILENFTTALNEIEKDYDTLMQASEKYRQSLENTGKNEGNENLVSIHNQTISEDTLGSRVLSGYDALVIMWRRNLLFQSYEKAMFEIMKQIGPKVMGLDKGMASWNDGGGPWDIGSRVVDPYPCEASKYKKKKMWKWRTNYYMSTRDRWAWHYEINGNAPANADIIKREKIANILGLLSGHEATGADNQKNSPAGEAVKKAIEVFTSQRYYLMDPFIFGGMTNKMFGQEKPLGKGGGFLGFSGFKDLRNARYIRGDEAGSFTKMHALVKENIREFYKSLKQKKDQSKFIYEPELVSTFAKNCLDSDKTEKCREFEIFLNDVTDESFAYFLAHGHHVTDSYENYFRNAATYRRKLLAKLSVDIANISTFYEAIIKQRDRQNECIEKVMKGLIDNNILNPNNVSGVSEGFAKNSTGTTIGRGAKISNLNGSQGAAKRQNPKFSPPSRSDFSFNLKAGTLTNLSGKTILDNVPGSEASSVDSANISGQGSGFFAIKKSEMKDANRLATSKGVNVSGKDKAVNKLQSKIASGIGSSSLFGNSGIDRSKVQGNLPSGESQVGKKDVDGSEGPAGENVKSEKEEVVIGDSKNNKENITESAAAGLDPLTGLDYTGAPQDVGTSGINGDQGLGSGLSAEEQHKLLSEVERKKRQFLASEDDGLFKKVSKAYVRNLNKVLIRKKTLD
jgi:hypothetical protein